MITLYLLGLILLLAVGAAVSTLLISSLRNEVPIVFVPTDTLKVALDALGLQPGQTFYDLGSGSGRVVRAATRRGARSIGLDNNLSLILLSRLFRSGVYRRADLLQAEYRDADRVYLFLGPQMVSRLLPKLEAELKPGSIVASVDYPFSGRRADRVLKVEHERQIGHTVYIYNF